MNTLDIPLIDCSTSIDTQQQVFWSERIQQDYHRFESVHSTNSLISFRAFQKLDDFPVLIQIKEINFLDSEGYPKEEALNEVFELYSSHLDYILEYGYDYDRSNINGQELMYFISPYDPSIHQKNNDLSSDSDDEAKKNILSSISELTSAWSQTSKRKDSVQKFVQDVERSCRLTNPDEFKELDLGSWQIFSRLLYNGESKYEKPHGLGRISSICGRYIYEGNFKDGMKHGFGVELNYKLDRSTSKYVGEFKNDKKHGRGVSYSPSDLSFISFGQWKNGLLDGLACYLGEDGLIQDEGETKQGTPSGYVRCIMQAKLAEYRGQFVNGKANGFGINYIITDQESERFNKRISFRYEENGAGCEWTINSKGLHKTLGRWTTKGLDGKVKEFTAFNNIVEAVWINGVVKQPVSIKYFNGDSYYGNVDSDFHKSGWGSLTVNQGVTIEAEWRNGMPEGNCRITCSDGRFYEGDINMFKKGGIITIPSKKELEDMRNDNPKRHSQSSNSISLPRISLKKAKG